MKSETVSTESFTGLDYICYVNLHQRYTKVVNIIRIFKKKLYIIYYFANIVILCIFSLRYKYKYKYKIFEVFQNKIKLASGNTGGYEHRWFKKIKKKLYSYNQFHRMLLNVSIGTIFYFFW